MKRWLRRILLACSLALMLAAVGLTIRGMFVEEIVRVGPVACLNATQTIYFFTFNAERLVEYERMPEYTIISNPRLFLPGVGAHAIGSFFINVPHWTYFLLSSAYLCFAWMRHRRRMGKDVGFPVEVSANEPRVEASQARTSPR